MTNLEEIKSLMILNNIQEKDIAEALGKTTEAIIEELSCETKLKLETYIAAKILVERKSKC